MTIIEDLDDEDRSCIICDKHDSRNLLEIAKWKTSHEADVETGIWLCDICVAPLKNKIDRHVTDEIEMKEKEKLR